MSSVSMPPGEATCGVRNAGRTTKVILGRSAAAQAQEADKLVSAEPTPFGFSSPSAPARDPLQMVEAYRQHGTELFRAGRVEEALSRYQRALEVLEEDRGRVPTEKFEALQTILELNASQACLGLSYFEKATAYANSVLSREPTNSKALYRSAEAHGEVGNFEKAALALENLRAQGEEKLAAAGFARLTARKKRWKDEARAQAARMLGVKSSSAALSSSSSTAKPSLPTAVSSSVQCASSDIKLDSHQTQQHHHNQQQLHQQQQEHEHGRDPEAAHNDEDAFEGKHDDNSSRDVEGEGSSFLNAREEGQKEEHLHLPLKKHILPDIEARPCTQEGLDIVANVSTEAAMLPVGLTLDDMD